MADVLELEGANVFRVRAYRNAARTVEELPEAVDAVVHADPRRLTELPGIGQDLAGKIREIVLTGGLQALKDVERHAPQGAVTLMQVPGLGPKRAKALCEALKVRSLADLARAARRGRVRSVKGFGEKTEQKILQELQTRTVEAPRMLRSVAAQYADSLLGYLRDLPGVSRAEVAGSFRRCRETVADLDVLVLCDQHHGGAVTEQFVLYPEVEHVLAHGPTKSSVRLRCGLQVDLRVLPEECYGAALHYFTGSKAHNIAVRRLGQQRGLKINEYGIFSGARRVGGIEESEIYDAVGLPWIAPELREDRGEIDAAREGKLPRLIEPADIRGDLHVHTTSSDGRDTLTEMAAAAEAMGYEYLAIADHTPALKMVRGLDAAGFRRQMRQIDRLNARLRKLTVLKGAEVDIHPDGSLDLKDADLEALDVVLVAIHSKFDLPPEQQTRRMLRALGQPAVDILAHPTGRLIGRRAGLSFDFEQVCKAAADHGVFLEVNGQPERLDLDDTAARSAIGRGLTLVISTDAHSTAELRFMRWGVDQARRAWAQSANVANALSLKNLLKLFHRARKRA
jgi:DNA polymerase (family 10)